MRLLNSPKKFSRIVLIIGGICNREIKCREKSFIWKHFCRSTCHEACTQWTSNVCYLYRSHCDNFPQKHLQLDFLASKILCQYQGWCNRWHWKQIEQISLQTRQNWIFIICLLGNECLSYEHQLALVVDAAGWDWPLSRLQCLLSLWITFVALLWGLSTPQTNVALWIGYRLFYLISNCKSPRSSFQVSSGLDLICKNYSYWT